MQALSCQPFVKRMRVPAVALAAAMLPTVLCVEPLHAADEKVTVLDRFRMEAFCRPTTPLVSVEHRKVPQGSSPPNKAEVLNLVVRKLRLARLYSPDSNETRLHIQVHSHRHALMVGVSLYKALSDGTLIHNEPGRGKQGKNFNVGYMNWATPLPVYSVWEYGGDHSTAILVIETMVEAFIAEYLRVNAPTCK